MLACITWVEYFYRLIITHLIIANTENAAIDAPGGFLFEWWSVFWDIFIARTNEKHSETAAAYLEVTLFSSFGFNGVIYKNDSRAFS